MTVKVGCFHINPASKRGKRIFLLQMLVVCFVPHVALIIQNCSIMAQLSQTLDSSLYLDTEVNTLLKTGELTIQLQDERLAVAQYLFSSSRDIYEGALQTAFAVTDDGLHQLHTQNIQNDIMTLYHFREDLMNFKTLKKEDAFRRMKIYEDINTNLLLYIARNVKTTTSSLWRQLSAASEILHSREHLSLSLVLTMYASNFQLDPTIVTGIKIHMEFGRKGLNSTYQYFEVEKIVKETKALSDVSNL